MERERQRQDWAGEEAMFQGRPTSSYNYGKEGRKPGWAQGVVKLQGRSNSSQLTPHVVLELECLSELPSVGSWQPDLYIPTSVKSFGNVCHLGVWVWPEGNGTLSSCASLLRWSLKSVMKTGCGHTLRSWGSKPFPEGLSGRYMTGKYMCVYTVCRHKFMLIFLIGCE